MRTETAEEIAHEEERHEHAPFLAHHLLWSVHHMQSHLPRARRYYRRTDHLRHKILLAHAIVEIDIAEHKFVRTTLHRYVLHFRDVDHRWLPASLLR